VCDDIGPDAGICFVHLVGFYFPDTCLNKFAALTGSIDSDKEAPNIVGGTCTRSLSFASLFVVCILLINIYCHMEDLNSVYLTLCENVCS
jgi:hypothetical protein